MSWFLDFSTAFLLSLLHSSLGLLYSLKGGLKAHSFSGIGLLYSLVDGFVVGIFLRKGLLFNCFSTLIAICTISSKMSLECNSTILAILYSNHLDILLWWPEGLRSRWPSSLTPLSPYGNPLLEIG
jgi:hypothetical protein